MKSAVLFIFALLFAASNIHAETRYITENLAVMVRTGPSTERRIISMPISGSPIEVLEETEDGWSRVRLPNDDEGWVLSRYLVAGPPSKQVIEQLQRENAKLSAQVSNLSTKNIELRNAKSNLETDYKEKKNTADSLKVAYETLKSESAEFLAMKAAYEKTRRQLDEKTQQVEELEVMVQTLQQDQSLWWLIAGSSAVLLGFIIGYVSRRPKRSSYLR